MITPKEIPRQKEKKRLTLNQNPEKEEEDQNHSTYQSKKGGKGINLTRRDPRNYFV